MCDTPLTPTGLVELAWQYLDLLRIYTKPKVLTIGSMLPLRMLHDSL